MLNKKGMRFVFFTAQNLCINPQLPLHSVHRLWLLHKHSRLIIIRTYCEFVLGSCGFKFAHFSSHAQSSGIANNNRPIRSISYTNARKSAYKIKKNNNKKLHATAWLYANGLQAKLLHWSVISCCSSPSRSVTPSTLSASRSGRCCWHG